MPCPRISPPSDARVALHDRSAQSQNSSLGAARDAKTRPAKQDRCTLGELPRFLRAPRNFLRRDPNVENLSSVPSCARRMYCPLAPMGESVLGMTATSETRPLGEVFLRSSFLFILAPRIPIYSCSRLCTAPTDSSKSSELKIVAQKCCALSGCGCAPIVFATGGPTHIQLVGRYTWRPRSNAPRRIH